MSSSNRLKDYSILLIAITCILFILFGTMVHGIITDLQMYHFEEVGRNYIQFIQSTLSELIRADIEYGFVLAENEFIIEFCDAPESLISSYKAERYVNEIIYRIEDIQSVEIVPYKNVDERISKKLIDLEIPEIVVSPRYFDTHPYYSSKVYSNETGLVSYNISLPVRKEGVAIGVVNMTLGLAGFETNFIENSSYQKTGSFIIADSVGEILIQSKVSTVGHDELMTALSEFNGNDPIVYCQAYERYFYIKTEEFTNDDEILIHFVFAQDKSELFNARNKMVRYAGLMIVLFILIYSMFSGLSSLYYNYLIAKDAKVILEETVVYEVEKQTKVLRKIASRDSLTKIYNHAAMIEKLEASIERAKKNQTAICVLMLDIDYFKRINDNHGHPIGDEVLVELSGLLLKNIRHHDAAGRYGGEEFIIILNETAGDIGYLIAERIRTEIQENEFTELRLKITISIGMSEYRGEDALTLIKSADKKLYDSKKMGRNRTTI
ncbi:MAG: GGDEF domain-containing protein [Clostridiales bacterium]|nr:GGDEF domain-containing protein [Clostridiales bacterium]